MSQLTWNYTDCLQFFHLLRVFAMVICPNILMIYLVDSVIHTLNNWCPLGEERH